KNTYAQRQDFIKKNHPRKKPNSPKNQKKDAGGIKTRPRPSTSFHAQKSKPKKNKKPKKSNQTYFILSTFFFPAI
ncbi:hypothetical protein LJC36_04890, partial [Desulfovibrio sp. OttesenSCG-928-C14]|nr:hypothetical protein [Desulfovibrio sp. OttesenSCG-928-C14]